MKTKVVMPLLVPVALITVVFLLPKAKDPAAGRATPSRPSALRIVSLAPSVTEMLFAMDLGDAVVGVTDYCNYPAPAKGIRHVGGFVTPNIETILELHPDLVVTADYKRREALSVLEQSGIRSLNVTTGSFENLFQAFRQIGEATRHASQAQGVVNRMRDDLKALARQYHFENLPDSKRPRIFMEIWHDPITTVGRASILNELIGYAGGVNVAGDIADMYPVVSPEKVIEWKPDVVIVCYMTSKGKNTLQMASRIGWKDIPAVKENRVYCDIPRDLLLRPGPRLVEGARRLAEHLYRDSRP